MKLKLDLHPIYSDSNKIESSLVAVIAEAVDKRATEVEIIPGKGSGALKKTVLRFLDRPEIKAQYHRVEKDDENFGRVFVHFRHSPVKQAHGKSDLKPRFTGKCFCCQADIEQTVDDAPGSGESITVPVECPTCGSPNLMTVIARNASKFNVACVSGYEEN